MKISLVIPAYNEEEYIGRCLGSVLSQEVMPDEIIVVDNNSTDRTAEIVSRFPVRLIRESKQGIAHARNAGFDAATGHVIARTDADTILPSDWIARIGALFAAGDIDAFTGPAAPYDLPLMQSSKPVEAYLLVAKFIQKGVPTMIGFNMAVTATMWKNVRESLCNDDKKVHEDVDLALKIHKAGGRISYAKPIMVFTSARRLKKKPGSFLVEYPVRFVKTCVENADPHNRFGQTLRAFPVHKSVSAIGKKFTSAKRAKSR